MPKGGDMSLVHKVPFRDPEFIGIFAPDSEVAD